MESDDGLLFLDADDVISIHTALMARTNPDNLLYEDPIEPGILNEDAITSAVERARWGPFPRREDLPIRAAFLVRGIAQAHPFVDGNKRTAFEAGDVFLRVNGYTTTASAEEVIGFVRDVAQGMSVGETEQWIRSRLRKI